MNDLVLFLLPLLCLYIEKGLTFFREKFLMLLNLTFVLSEFLDLTDSMFLPGFTSFMGAPVGSVPVENPGE